MPVVWTDGLSGGRAVGGHVTTRFSRMGRLLHFLTHGALLACESSAMSFHGETNTMKQVLLVIFVIFWFR